jgi:Protein of unknown function (DUF732)
VVSRLDHTRAVEVIEKLKVLSSSGHPSTPFTPRPNADDLFMMALTHFGMRVTADNIPKTIAVGHQVCTYIGQGRSNGQRPSMDGRPWTPPVIRHRTHTLGGPCRSRPTQLITAYVLP